MYFCVQECLPLLFLTTSDKSFSKSKLKQETYFLTKYYLLISSGLYYYQESCKVKLSLRPLLKRSVWSRCAIARPQHSQFGTKPLSPEESWLLLSGKADVICVSQQLTWLPGGCREALPHANGPSLPNLFHRLKCLNDNAGKSSEVSSHYMAGFHPPTETKMGAFRCVLML